MSEAARREIMQDALIEFDWEEYGIEKPPLLDEGEPTDLLVDLAVAVLRAADGD